MEDTSFEALSDLGALIVVSSLKSWAKENGYLVPNRASEEASDLTKKIPKYSEIEAIKIISMTALLFMIDSKTAAELFATKMDALGKNIAQRLAAEGHLRKLPPESSN